MKTWTLTLCTWLAVVAGSLGRAEECCVAGADPGCACETSTNCNDCGCGTCLRKVCRVVEDVKKTPKTTYSCECEDFCIPGKSTFCGFKCVCDPCCGSKLKKIWKPTCGEVRTKSVLKKTITQEEEKTHKYEVVTICTSCAHRCRGRIVSGACASDTETKQPAASNEESTATEVASASPAPLAPEPNALIRAVSTIRRAEPSTQK